MIEIAIPGDFRDAGLKDRDELRRRMQSCSKYKRESIYFSLVHQHPQLTPCIFSPSASTESSSSVQVFMDTTTTTTTRISTQPTTVSTATASTTTTTTFSSTRSPALSVFTPRAHTTTIELRPPGGSGPLSSTRPPPSSVLPNYAAEFCNPTVEAELTWPKTRQGLTATQPCPFGTIGNASFACMGPDGLWDLQGPDLSNCTSAWVNIISQKIRAGEPAAIVSRELSEQTKNRIHSGDITYTVRALGQLVDLLDVQLRNLTPGGKDSAARSLNKLHIKLFSILDAFQAGFSPKQRLAGSDHTLSQDCLTGMETRISRRLRYLRVQPVKVL
ncbi:adhesion G protein-coupled receptor L3 isoform X1 [Tachysurus ichikawai]